jgi:beta-glucosidase
VSVDVRNVGSQPGDDVVELYVAHPTTPFSAPNPIRSLAGFQRISLRPNQTKTVEFLVDARGLSLVDQNGARFDVPGRLEIAVGGAQPGHDGRYASPSNGVTAHVTISGSQKEI